MRCRTCDYRLWNLHSRKCPECGTDFLPSEYEFAINSVQFCCPHCSQAYYGTGARGHLDPQEFDCVSCGTALNMDDMVLLPTAGVEEEQTQVEVMPWLDRSRRGAIRSWLSCVGMALVAPGRMMRLTPLNSSLATAFWFAVFTHVLVVAAGVLPLVVFGFLMSGVPGMGAGIGGVGCFVLIGIVVVIAIEGLVTHVLLRMTGETAGGLGRTYHAICYSGGASVVCATPCLGWYFGWIWWLISATLMVKEAQRASGLRAAFATLTPPLLCGAGALGLYVWWFMSMMSAMPTPGMNQLPLLAADPQRVVDGVYDYAAEHSGDGPEHAIQLVDDGFVTTQELRGLSRAADPALDGYELLDDTQQRDMLVRTTVLTMDDDTIAHRVGEFVFCHHGVNLNDADERLWIVVHWPTSYGNAGRGRWFSIGLADQTVEEHPCNTINALLAKQNRVRAEHNLPPLPHPVSVTAFMPAVAPSTGPPAG